MTWLLLGAIAFSWLGDGAATFFPFDDELPPMLACFGVAHLLYIWLFAKHLQQQPFPRWALIYIAWWIAMVAVLWPHLGGLAGPVAVYGLVLGGTAAFASRCGPIIAAGGVFFLVSDTILCGSFSPTSSPAPSAAPRSWPRTRLVRDSSRGAWSGATRHQTPSFRKRPLTRNNARAIPAAPSTSAYDIKRPDLGRFRHETSRFGSESGRLWHAL